MAEIKGMMLQLSPRESSPKKLLIEINQKLYEHLDRRMFVTMIYGILDYGSGRFTFCRAGHNALLHLNENGEHHFLTPRGIGLGLDPGELFAEKIEEKSLQLENHDILVFYTDGVTEAMNQRHEEFGEERLLDYFESKKSDEVTVQKKHLLIAVENFLNGQSPQDDMTLVIVKRDQ
jgi:serine phosphatase RsbU (regulator of sigma subunit)